MYVKARFCFVLAVVLGASACKQTKERYYERMYVAGDRWSSVVWGQPLSTKQREQTEERLDCLWGGLKERGLNPSADFACQALRMEAAADCQEEAPDDLKDCRHEFESACAVSDEFVELARSECKLPARVFSPE